MMRLLRSCAVIHVVADWPASDTDTMTHKVGTAEGLERVP
jgi:hypothetical protein